MIKEIEEIEEIMDEDDDPRLCKLKTFAKICVIDIWKRIFLANSRFSIQIKYQENTNQITVEILGDRLHRINKSSPVRAIDDPFIYVLEPGEYTSKDEATISKMIVDDLRSKMDSNSYPNATINTSNPNNIEVIGKYLDA